MDIVLTTMRTLRFKLPRCHVPLNIIVFYYSEFYNLYAQGTGGDIIILEEAAYCDVRDFFIRRLFWYELLTTFLFTARVFL